MLVSSKRNDNVNNTLYFHGLNQRIESKLIITDLNKVPFIGIIFSLKGSITCSIKEWKVI